MATGTVKSTPEALQAVQRMLSQIDGGITESIERFKADGDILANPQNFDGGAAARYQGEWGQVKGTLANAIEQLREMSTRLRQINDNIQSAGGN